MPSLPTEALAVLLPFASLFTAPTFVNFQLLFMGAVMAPGQRTVASCLRSIGLEHESNFSNFHRVLNRAPWSAREGSRLLFVVLVCALVPFGPILLGLDDTVERRRGDKIKAKGIYRDPVRSSQGHFVKCSGLRWLSLMLLAPVPFAKRTWALPFLTGLCPSSRFYEKHRAPRAPKTLTDHARQMLQLVRRWLPHRQIIVVADSGFAVLELLASWLRCPPNCSPIIAITRLRLDAALFEPAPARKPGQMGRPRVRGKRLPALKDRLKRDDFTWSSLSLTGWYDSSHPNEVRTIEVASDTAVWSNGGKAVVPIRWVVIRDPKGQFETQALLSTGLDLEPAQILGYFVQRWQVEVTFREAREHLGMETQRQWNDRAIERTTPLLLAMYSLVTLLAHNMDQTTSSVAVGHRVRASAWYRKDEPTFSDALAWVRRSFWRFRQEGFLTSVGKTDLNETGHVRTPPRSSANTNLTPIQSYHSESEKASPQEPSIRRGGWNENMPELALIPTKVLESMTSLLCYATG